MSVRTLEGGASRVCVTSSDDSRVDRIACAGTRSAGKRELYSIFMLTFAFYSSARTPAFNFFGI